MAWSDHFTGCGTNRLLADATGAAGGLESCAASIPRWKLSCDLKGRPRDGAKPVIGAMVLTWHTTTVRVVGDQLARNRACVRGYIKSVWKIFRRKPLQPQKVTTGRFEIEQIGEVAYLEYSLSGNILELIHTEIPEKLRRMGLASSLAETALGWARERALMVD